MIVAEGPETCASLVAISPPDVHVVAALSVGNFAKLAKYIVSKKPKVRYQRNQGVRKGDHHGVLGLEIGFRDQHSRIPVSLKQTIEISGTSDFCWR